jgi:hypothetical protein
MAVQFNHTIISATDSVVAATFLAEILGLPAPHRFGPFLTVEMDNGVSLDYQNTEAPIKRQHYAFLISEGEFDQIFERVKSRNLSYWADPRQGRLNEINRQNGGRGFYFEDPNSHLLEVMTRPYQLSANAS